MAYSKQDALAALESVEAVQRRTHIVRGYERGAPHLLLWGVIWIAGYTISDVYPYYAGYGWLVLNAIGIFAGFFLKSRCQPIAATPSYQVRYFGVFIAAGVFVAATCFLMKPISMQQLNAFPALVVAFIYALIGCWVGVRFTITGGVLAALTLAGYALLRNHFALWMAVVGGGALLLAGVWLRRG